ncbi:hypothetical protein Peur_025036 [Populus x canadensis]
MRNLSSPTSTRSRSVPTPCCSKVGIKKGPWTPEEDELLANYIRKEGFPLVYFSYLSLSNPRWSLIAGRIPGRTDNEIKNYWNTCLSKKLISQGIDPRTHKPLKPNPDSSEIANVPVQNSNPKSSPLDENGRVYRTVANRVSENFTGTNLDQSPNQVAADATENWPNRDGFNMGSLQIGHGRKNEDDFIEEIGNEDTFSSFLDSLLNENVFVYQQQQQLQQQNMFGPSFKLAVSSSQILSHANIWEAEVSPPMAALGDKGVGGASNSLPV